MLSLKARNVNDALHAGLLLLHAHGVEVPCRPNAAGDKVVEVPCPVATTYAMPRERVLWCPTRDANPFFHFFEALWILAGRDDVAFLTRFNKRMAEFNDNGKTFHGAYGYRLRKHFRAFNDDERRRPRDQVDDAISALRNDPGTRRVVLQIWDCETDWVPSKDIPCNDLIFLKVRDGALHMTVCCRSNDAVWGAYGANVVQFSMLQEYIAAHVGVEVGPYTQISDSFHVYTGNPYWEWFKGAQLDPVDLYQGDTEPYPLFQYPVAFDDDLKMFFTGYDRDNMPAQDMFATTAFRNVVLPLFYSHTAYKGGSMEAALRAVSVCAAPDWRHACALWLSRRVRAGRVQVAR